MKKILSCLCIIASSFATMQTSNAQADIQYAETRMVRITAYYSPLPNQENYSTGGYESDKRLNGHGIRGADFTPVYPGMIAAPSNIPFGTIICIPTYGCGAKHDTGGAIVKAGERDIAKYDRLDLWMGHGDAGLNRALAWGMQDHLVTLYPENSDIAEYVDLNLPMGILKSLGTPQKTEFTRDLYKEMNGTDIYFLQKKLNKWGYLEANPTGYFGTQTGTAILNFQKDNQIVQTQNETGAGMFGKKTRNAFHLKMQPEIYQNLEKKYDTFTFTRELNHDERSFDVYMMQALLEHEGFFDDHVGGFFGPITKKSVTDFQLHYGIIKSETQAFAGYVGPKTKQKLNNRLHYFKPKKSYPSAYRSRITNTKIDLDLDLLIGDSLSQSMEGERVRLLQKGLRQLGNLNTVDTGYFGPKTRKAIIDFQLKNNIIPHEGAQGTGVFGPATQLVFQEKWGQFQ